MIKKKMIEMRQGGATYPEIMDVTGVTKERCIAYLKDVIPGGSPSALDVEWRIAENEGRKILTNMGFIAIHNLNDLCSFPPYWDYLAEKEGRYWLIDVTVNGQKSISAKRDAMVEGYENAILLKNDVSWKLIKFSMNVEQIIKV